MRINDGMGTPSAFEQYHATLPVSSVLECNIIPHAEHGRVLVPLTLLKELGVPDMAILLVKHEIILRSHHRIRCRRG